MEYVESRNPSATVAAIRREPSLVKNALTTVPILALRIIIALRYSHALTSFVNAKSFCVNNKNQCINYRMHDNIKYIKYNSLIYSI